MAGAIHRASVRSVEEILNGHPAGISNLQFGLLMSLRQEAQTSRELSRMFGLDPSTLVPSVNGLVTKGYVQRGTDLQDRRRVPLSITEQGHALIAAIMNHLHDQTHDIIVASLQQMGESKQAQLIALLRELILGLPDGEQMVQGMIDRMNAYLNTEPPDGCHTPDSESASSTESQH
ncbi:MAG: MarR family winged helix-turn-helix transcriptional regulator [bacterium]|nr:MarR family winged helix-turn-helix transcriptional regulator [bacterium]